jgi:hypothetical protein
LSSVLLLKNYNNRIKTIIAVVYIQFIFFEDLPAISTEPSDLGSINTPQNFIRTKKSSTIEQSRRKKAQVSFLPSTSSSSTKLSPGMC